MIRAAAAVGTFAGSAAATFAVFIGLAIGVIAIFGGNNSEGTGTMEATVQKDTKAEPKKEEAVKPLSAADKAIEEARKILEAAWSAEKDPVEKAKLLAAANAMLAAVKPPMKAKLDGKWTEKVTIRPYGGPGRLLDPHKDLSAYPVKLAGSDGFAVKGAQLWKAGTELEQADGTIWMVLSSHDAGDEIRFVVRKKP